MPFHTEFLLHGLKHTEGEKKMHKMKKSIQSSLQKRYIHLQFYF